MHLTFEGRDSSSERENERRMSEGLEFGGGISAVGEFRRRRCRCLLAVARYLFDVLGAMNKRLRFFGTQIFVLENFCLLNMTGYHLSIR